MSQQFDPETYRVTVPYPSLDAIRQRVTEDVLGGRATIPAQFILEPKEWIKQEAKKLYDVAMGPYEKAEEAARAQFEKDMEDKHMRSTWPKELKGKLHSMAWEHGHSHGYGEVDNSYYDLVEIAEAAWDAARSA